MIKRILFLGGLLLVSLSAAADEGMWPVRDAGAVYPRMRAAGLRLPLSDFLNPEASSLADALVAIDGGVGTGSFISQEGLVITNHHVCHGDICALSVPGRNVLENGYWASSKAEELPLKGRTAWVLRYVEDCTLEVQALADSIRAAGKWAPMSMRRVYTTIERRYARPGCEVVCKQLWHGLRYELHLYEVYRDVRFVGAPPVSVAAFGGDYDNWSWPQHKGDFALLRVYAAPDGSPADYAPGNVPLRPRRVLTLSTRGVEEGDFTLVAGFPGRTDRYAPSAAIRERLEIKNPIVVRNRHERMAILRRNMERDSTVRMAYSDAFFMLSNYADFTRWETRCLKRFGVADLRRAEEERMQRWIDADPARRAAYGTLLADLDRGFAARREAERNLNFFREAWLGPSEALLTANRVASFLGKLDRTGRDSLRHADPDARSVFDLSRRLAEGYDAATDCELFARMAVNFTASVPREAWGEALGRMYDAAGGDADRMAREAFAASYCTSAERFDTFFSRDRSVGEVRRDPLVALTESVRVQRFTGDVDRAEKSSVGSIQELIRRYVRALHAFRQAQGIPQYPDANSTLRLSYGHVRRLDPADGVHFDWRSTTTGILEKSDPDRYEYRVDARLGELLRTRDWGRWGGRDALPVAFLTDNDITGGNSGSPVLDARGRVVGLAFDGNRESMAGDLWFHPDLARTVCVDIRYVLWLIEHHAGAGWLLGELTLE